MRTFLSLCSACLLAASAQAQTQATDNPDNPHSSTARHKSGSDVSNSQTNAQTDQGENANPHSVRNRDDSAKPAGRADVQAAEKNNPDSSDFRDREKMGVMDHAGMDHDMMTNASPQQILQKLHMANQKEISMGRLAEQNGTEKVKDYAQTLERDHQDADQKVMDLAKRKGFSLSDTPKSADTQQKMRDHADRLSGLKGAEFDRAFTNMMAMGHRHLLQMAQGWTSNCKDQDVCSLLNTLLPKLQQHAQTAERLRGPVAQGRSPQPEQR